MNAALARSIKVSPDLLEMPIDQNANGLADYLSLSVQISGETGSKVLIRATFAGYNGLNLVAADTPVILRSSMQHVNFDFNGPLIRRLQMTAPFALELSIRDPEAPDTVIKTVSFQLKRNYDYRTFEN